MPFNRRRVVDEFKLCYKAILNESRDPEEVLEAAFRNLHIAANQARGGYDPKAKEQAINNLNKKANVKRKTKRR